MICSVIGHDTVSNPKILHNYVHDYPSLIVSVRMFIFSHPWNYQEGIQRQKTQTSKVLVIHLLSVNSFIKITLSIIVAHLQAKIKVFFGCNQTGVSHFTNFQTAKPHFLTSQVKQKAHLIWDTLQTVVVFSFCCWYHLSGRKGFFLSTSLQCRWNGLFESHIMCAESWC